MQGILISIREASLVIRQRDEAVLQVLKFTAFLSVGRTLDEFISLSRDVFSIKALNLGSSTHVVGDQFDEITHLAAGF